MCNYGSQPDDDDLIRFLSSPETRLKHKGKEVEWKLSRFFFFLMLVKFFRFLGLCALRLITIIACVCAPSTKPTHSSNSSSFHHIHQINIALTPPARSLMNKHESFRGLFACAYETIFLRESERVKS